MPTKIIKRLTTPADQTLFLLQEVLVYSLGWPSVETSFTTIPLAVGVDGEVLASQPTTFRSPSSAFNATHVGKWLTVYNSEFVNNGIYQIAGVISPTELLLSGGLYGASFVDGMGVSFRVVDPAAPPPLVVGFDYFVVSGKAGSSPLWQVQFLLSAADTIDISVSPSAGWVPSPTSNWSVTVPPTVSISESLGNPNWYFLVDDTHIRAWTVDAAGTGVNQIAYVGAIDPRRPSDDTKPIVSFAGVPLVSLANIGALDDSLTTPVNYSAVVYGSAAFPSVFPSLPSSLFDLRNDSAKIPIGTDTPTFEEDDRGYLRGLHFVSDQIPYRSFVDNGRSLLSLGNGIAVEWDGSLSR